MKVLLTSCLVFIFSIHLTAQDCNCCSPKQIAFDFWVGEWTVYDTTGQEVGKNSITKLESGCILNEHWRGSKGSTGRSYNYFDQQDSTWNQLWIDNQGGNLKLKGNTSQEGIMILKSDLIKGKKGFYYNQITWTKMSEDKVVQLWEVYRKDQTKIAELFRGIYKRD